MNHTARDTTLLLDVMLGKLATYLRMCGYDAAYALDRDAEPSEGHDPSDRTSGPRGDPLVDDDEILVLAREEGRLLLTRDVQLAGRTEDSLLLAERDVGDQLRELADAGFDLSLSEPSRCARCNGVLERVDPDGETPAYAPSPAETDVWRCRSCGQRYWKGSHWEDVEERLAGL